jgi:hypothetical protein
MTNHWNEKEIILRKSYDSFMAAADNENGATMIATLMILLLLTIIGVAGISTSTTETMISAAEAEKRSTFYAAESGAELAVTRLKTLFVDSNLTANLTALAGGGSLSPASWTFALDGTKFGGSTAQPQPTPPSNWKARFDSGVALPWIPDEQELTPGYTYTVRIWDNGENQDASTTLPEQNDMDGIIVVGAIATGPHSSRSAVEIVLYGTNGPGTASAYTAQAGGGQGKNYNAADARAISDANLSGLTSNAGLR